MSNVSDRIHGMLLDVIDRLEAAVVERNQEIEGLKKAASDIVKADEESDRVGI
jgi:hypothetical protein